MSTHASATFETKQWDESPYNEADGLPKMTRASVTQSIAGDIEGEGAVEYLMTYGGEAASYVFVQRVIGSLGGRTGSFVIQGSGDYSPEASKASGTYAVVPRSGTGDLTGLLGTGSFEAPAGSRGGTMTLDYDLD